MRQWPGLGHAECYVCGVSEKSPSKAVGYMTQRGRRWEGQGSPFGRNSECSTSPRAPCGVCRAQSGEKADSAPPS